MFNKGNKPTQYRILMDKFIKWNTNSQHDELEELANELFNIRDQQVQRDARRSLIKANKSKPKSPQLPNI